MNAVNWNAAWWTSRSSPDTTGPSRTATNGVGQPATSVVTRTVPAFEAGVGLPAGYVAIGDRVIDRVPPSIKQLAIDWFGTNDKDTAWQTVGSAKIETMKFTIANPPLPAGTTVRVLVEAKDGSYLALSGPITLK